MNEDFTDVILVTEDKKQPSTSDQIFKLIEPHTVKNRFLKVIGVVVVHEIFCF